MNPAATDSYTAQDLDDTICQLQGIEAAVRRRLLAFVAAYDRKEAWRADGASSMAAWLCYRLNLDHASAAEMVEVAHALDELPAIAATYGDGRLSWDQLRHLVRLAAPENDADYAERAPEWPAKSIQRAARRLQATRRRQADDEHDRRFLWLRHEGPTGALRIRGRLPAAEGAVVKAALERLASKMPTRPDGVHEPFDARCADALVGVASARIASDTDADRATVVLHVDASVLDGDDGAAELEDGPALSAETARRLTCDGRIQTLLHGRDGSPIGIGRTSRNVPPWLYRQVRHRDQTCRWPGCSRRHLVNAHHIDPWIPHGRTDLDNLCLLCRYHHRLVHEGGWKVRGDPSGELIFLRPDGTVLANGPPGLDSAVRRRLMPEPVA